MRPVETERRVGQEEDRLGLDAGGAKQAKPLLANSRVSALVRQDVTCLVRLGGERYGDSAALPGDAVRADVVLDEEPRRRLVVSHEDAVREPAAVQAAGLVGRLGKRHVQDVERAPRKELRALLGSDRIVRRSHKIRERTGRAGVADGAERLHVGHPRERTNAPGP